MPTYNEHKTNQQSNINWGETFKMGVKAPVVADRIFDTYADADAYIKDVNSSAIAGLIISVINDGVNNGIYYVNSDIYGTVDRCGNPVLYLYKQPAPIISNGVLCTTYIDGFSPDFVQLQDPFQTDIIPSAPKPFIQVSGTQVSLTCKAGVTYVCGNLDSLSFTLTASSYTDYIDEYNIIFTSPSTPTSITWPSGIEFCGSSSAPIIEANASYKINIANNLCIVDSFGVNSGGGGGSSTLSGLSDVNFTSLANGQIMEYNNNTGKWVNTNKTTYSDFTGATSLVAGTNGLVPAPTISDPDNYLKGDGTWASPVSVQFNNHTLQITT